jgi:Ca2+-binding RTX toxin-like protein
MTGSVTVSIADGIAIGAGGNDMLSGFENVLGGVGADCLLGNTLANHLIGSDGDDTAGEEEEEAEEEAAEEEEEEETEGNDDADDDGRHNRDPNGGSDIDRDEENDNVPGAVKSAEETQQGKPRKVKALKLWAKIDAKNSDDEWFQVIFSPIVCGHCEFM